MTKMCSSAAGIIGSLFRHKGSLSLSHEIKKSRINPDRAPLKEVLGGQYNYREGGRQVLRQGA